jgi:hypothetical protein
MYRFAQKNVKKAGVAPWKYDNFRLELFMQE